MNSDAMGFSTMKHLKTCASPAPQVMRNKLHKHTLIQGSRAAQFCSGLNSQQHGLLDQFGIYQMNFVDLNTTLHAIFVKRDVQIFISFICY